MGWASGSYLMSEVIDAIHTHVADKSVRKDVYLDVIRAFQSEDCDTLCECLGSDPAFDEAFGLHDPYVGGQLAFEKGTPPEGCPHAGEGKKRTQWLLGWAGAKADSEREAPANE